ncbi:hypothetical protein MCAP1_001456 [Malassezia caprae]|uniref:Pentatricopeptide repeat-containing protein n=1 Tax=Malassezia caprae TaxID=1381934 RepID=A0AAF0E7Y7_9BASI|nr:hypothetical protein MCAP1_001456 [Malassezia caprae]
MEQNTGASAAAHIDAILEQVDSCLYAEPTREDRARLRRDVGKRLLAAGAADAAQIEATVLTGHWDHAFAQLRRLLEQKAPALQQAHEHLLQGHHLYSRHNADLGAAYRASKAVFTALADECAHEKTQVTYRGDAAARAAAFLQATPRAWALLQPPFPKVIHAVYTLLSSLKEPRAHVQAMLRAPRLPAERAQYAGIVALALANRGASQVAAGIVADILDARLVPHESVVRRVLRMLAPTKQHELAQPLVQWLEQHGTSASSLRYLALYHAELGHGAAMEQVLARLAPDASFVSHAHLVCEASRGDVAAVTQRIAVPTSEEEAFWLLRAHVRQDDASGARNVFRAVSSVYDSERLYSEMARMAAKLGDAATVLDLAAQLEGAGLVCSATTLTYMVQALGRAQLPEKAAALMARHASRGTRIERRVYVALMDAYIQVGHYPAVLGIYQWLQSQHEAALRPDASVYNTLLKAHVRRGTPVAQVLQCLLDMQRLGLTPDARTYALAVQSACDSGRLPLAEELFALADRSLAHGASLALHTILLHACLRAGHTQRARALWDQIQARGMEPSHVTLGVLIQSYASGTESSLAIAQELAWKRSDEAQAQRTTSSWATPALEQGAALENLLVPLMDAHGQRGDAWAAEHVFHRLLDAGEPVSMRALTSLMNAYRYAGDVDGVMRLWDECCDVLVPRAKAQVTAADALTMSASAKPLGAFQQSMLCLPLSIAIQTASRAGAHDKVAEIWTRAQDAGLAFDAQNWNHLCVALARADRLPEALHILETVLTEPTPAGSELRPHVEWPDDATLVQRLERNERDQAAFAANPLHQVMPEQSAKLFGPVIPPHRRPPQQSAPKESHAANALARLHEMLVTPQRQWFPAYETLRAVLTAWQGNKTMRDALSKQFPSACARVSAFERKWHAWERRQDDRRA